MPAKIWDSTNQAFKDAENPKIFVNGVMTGTNGKVFVNGVAKDAWNANTRKVIYNGGSTLNNYTYKHSTLGDYYAYAFLVFSLDLSKYTEIHHKSAYSGGNSYGEMLAWDSEARIAVYNGQNYELDRFTNTTAEERIVDISSLTGTWWIGIGGGGGADYQQGPSMTDYTSHVVVKIGSTYRGVDNYEMWLK